MDKGTGNQPSQSQPGQHVHPLKQEISEKEAARNESAHNTAEEDMAQDAELTASSPNDDLDEGETARLGEETDLI